MRKLLLVSMLFTCLGGSARAQVNLMFTATEDVDVEWDYLTSITDFSIRFDTAYPADTKFAIFKAEDKLPIWKSWATRDNFSLGKDRGSLPMIADLNALHPVFRDKVVQLINLCKKKGIEVTVVESFRTRAKQAQYFGMGRQYTRSAGGRSKHQYGLAVDIVPVINGEPTWHNKVLWKKIGVLGESLGLRWGGRWRSLYDPAHFEWTGGITSVHLAQGIYPNVSQPEKYPCIEEDLKTLQKYWDAWEAEQSMLARMTDVQ